MQPRFVLTGFASEFSLRRLAEELERRGLPVVAVDLAERALDPELVPAGDGPVVLVTSQHLAGTRSSLARGLPADADHYAAPATLRRRIGADALVFVAHDLDEPVLACEAVALSTFDLFCSPDDDSWWAAEHVTTVTTGWAGDFGDVAELDVPGVLFLTNLVHTLGHGGADHLRRTFPSALASDLAVKLPVWPELDRIGSELEREGVRVLDPSLRTSAIARAVPLIVTNGPSSVLAEARRLGRRPLCLEDPTLPFVHLAGPRGMDAVRCTDAEFAERREDAGVVDEPGAPFDTDAFLHAVSRVLA